MKTVEKQLAALGDRNAEADQRYISLKLAEWAKKNEAEAQHVWSMINNGQVAALMGKVSKRGAKLVLRRCHTWGKIQITDMKAHPRTNVHICAGSPHI